MASHATISQWIMEQEGFFAKIAFMELSVIVYREKGILQWDNSFS